jgi:hypothetical protein
MTSFINLLNAYRKHIGVGRTLEGLENNYSATCMASFCSPEDKSTDVWFGIKSNHWLENN